MQARAVSFHTRFAGTNEKIVLGQGEEVQSVVFDPSLGQYVVIVFVTHGDSLMRDPDGRLVTEDQARAACLARKTVV